LSAQQAYLYALSAMDRFVSSGTETPQQIDLTNANIQNYKNSLENLGMGKLQIEDIARNRQLTENILITAPANGFVLKRNVSSGQRFEKGTEFYQIADLSHIWILADMFENDAQYFRPGVQARVTLPYQKKTFYAKVSNVLPQFDAGSRTLKLRLEAENPGFLLRPDMFVDVELPVAFPAAITVPVDAVLYSGLKKTVYIDAGKGFFEPRDVETGWRFGDRVEIVKGLMPGERIVVSGNFLIDSESRMKAAAAGIYGTAHKDPVCGMDVDESKVKAAGRISMYGGKTYYFCSDGCKQEFEKDPDRALKKSSDMKSQETPSARKTQTLRGSAVFKDPICGMDVDEAKAKAAGRTSTYGGKTYYFCAEGCKKRFDEDPKRYLTKSEESRTVNHPATSGVGHD
jgi:RND family efflux transporter MFP subunit